MFQTDPYNPPSLIQNPLGQKRELGLMRKLLATFLVTCLLSGCGIFKRESNVDEHTSYDYSSDSYRELLKKYNDLVEKSNTTKDRSYNLQVASTDENKFLLLVDERLTKFTAEAERFQSEFLAAGRLSPTSRAAADAQLARVESEQRSVIQAINDLEKQLLKELDALTANVDSVYRYPEVQKAHLRALKADVVARGNQLTGIRSLLNQHAASLRSRYEISLTAVNLPAPAAPTRRIELRQEETRIATVTPNQGIYRDSTNTVQTLNTERAIIEYATRNGFRSDAATDGLKMSSTTGGILAFAEDKDKLPKAIEDMISHMKAKMNANSDDLELALAIDYSGSMSDDIEGVIKGLKDIVTSLENIRVVGRSVKIGIVTFGAAGREKVDLAFTANLTEVQTTLDRLLSDYSRNTHSTDPGEASYHGLNLAVSGLAWSSRNRMAIAITDEPSWELRTGNQTYVDQVQAALRRNGIQTSIYTIIVK